MYGNSVDRREDDHTSCGRERRLDNVASAERTAIPVGPQRCGGYGSHAVFLRGATMTSRARSAHRFPSFLGNEGDKKYGRNRIRQRVSSNCVDQQSRQRNP